MTNEARMLTMLTRVLPTDKLNRECFPSGCDLVASETQHQRWWQCHYSDQNTWPQVRLATDAGLMPPLAMLSLISLSALLTPTSSSLVAGQSGTLKISLHLKRLIWDAEEYLENQLALDFKRKCKHFLTDALKSSACKTLTWC